MKLATLAEGWKTYLTVAGLLGLALYQASTGDLNTAFQSVLSAFAVGGLRHVVDQHPKPPAALKRAARKASFLVALLMVPTAAVAADVRDCTVRIAVPGAGGSAVVIGHDQGRYLLSTAEHVVTTHRQATVLFRDGRAVHAQVVHRDPRADLALLVFTSREAFPTTSLGEDPAAGDPIWQVGYPGNRQTHRQELATTSGRARGTQAGRFYGDLVLKSGDSGGGFFDAQGRLVGVSCAALGSSAHDIQTTGGVATGPSASVIRLACQGIGIGSWIGISRAPG